MIRTGYLAILVVSVVVVGVWGDLSVYSVQPAATDVYANLKILQKPGACHNHTDFPNTIQCAEMKTCISFKQFNDTKCDCCGPTKNCSTCSDHSDEDRIPTGFYPECKDHPYYNFGLVYKCAKNHSICLSRILQWNNGQCDCCPEQNFNCNDPKCTDHSDEECPCNEWSQKYSCDGNCIAISKYNDTETDCYSDCTIEGNPTAQSACAARKTQSALKSNEDFCSMCNQKNTPYFRCTTGDRQCMPSTMVRDNKTDCDGKEDEDKAKHPDCPEQLRKDMCDPAATGCVMVLGSTINVDCKCENSTADVICNKNQKNRRRRLY